MKSFTEHFVSILCVVLLTTNQCTAVPNGLQLKYSFNTNLKIGTSLSNEESSKWSMSGKLIVQNFNSYKIIQLEDVKASAINGRSVHDKPNSFVPLASNTKVLKQPFVLLFGDSPNTFKSINLRPNEPLWSVNIKKALANMFHRNFTLGSLDYHEVLESNLFGICTVNYNMNSDDQTLTKIIKHDNCYTEEHPTPSKTNRITKVIYSFENEERIKRIYLASSFQYKLLKDENIFPEIIETQILDLIEHSDVKKPIDISQNTDSRNLMIDLDESIKSIKKKSKPTKDEWLKYFTILKNQLNEQHLNVITAQNYNVVEKLYELLADMDLKTLRDLWGEIRKSRDEQLMAVTSSLFPYIGLEKSVKTVDNFIDKVSDNTAMRTLSMGPFSDSKISLDVLEFLKEFITMKNPEDIVHQTAVLSFSNLVGNYLISKECTEVCRQEMNEYMSKYKNMFLERGAYQFRMSYLLGLINMGATDDLIVLIHNKTENRHIRTLALNALKMRQTLEPVQAFRELWPLVKNKCEHYEVRQGALSLLLKCNLPRTHINFIADYMRHIQNSQVENHLYNYFYTTLKSSSINMENIQHLNIQDFREPESNILTGNYIIDYFKNMPTFGSSYQLQVFGDPLTKSLHAVQLTHTHATMNQTPTTFSIYIKFEGVVTSIFNSDRGLSYPVSDLGSILRDSKVHLKSLKNVHCELVFYYNDRAVAGTYIDLEGLRYYIDALNNLVLYLRRNNIIGIPLRKKEYFVSTLGTPISTTVSHKYVLSSNVTNLDYIIIHDDSTEDEDNIIINKIRFVWTTEVNLESYNPLGDINHGVTKTNAFQILVNSKVNFDANSLILKWNHDENYLNILSDYKTAIYANKEDSLRRYCPKCDSLIIVNEPQDIKTYLQPLEFLGKNLNVTTVNCPDMKTPSKIIETFKIHNGEAMSFMSIAAISNVANMLDELYYTYLYDKCKIFIELEPYYKQPTKVFVHLYPDNNTLKLNITQQYLVSSKVLHHTLLTAEKKDTPTKSTLKVVVDNICSDGLNRQFYLDSDISYPPYEPNIFSIAPMAPTVTRNVLSYKIKGTKKVVAEVKSLFLVSDEQKSLVEESDMYQKCVKESSNMKHTAPTRNCYETSYKMSLYDNFIANIEIKHIPKIFEDSFNNIWKLVNTSNANNDINENKNILISYFVRNNTLLVDFEESNFNKRYNFNKIFADTAFKPKTSNGRSIMSILSSEDYCMISPRTVKSFTGETKSYIQEQSTNILALIDCRRNTRFGLRVTNYEDEIAFNLWAGENSLNVYKELDNWNYLYNKKTKIYEHIARDIGDEDNFSVDFLENNDTFIWNDKFKIYFSKEYITVTMRSIYNDILCGICSNQEDFILLK